MDTWGDRLKEIEGRYTSPKLDKNFPVYARLDGRSFSNYTRKFERPYDSRLGEAMIQTTEYLVQQTHADMGYTQSDEVSLVWYPDDNPESQFMFDGKIQKLASTLAGMCSSKFYSVILGEEIPSFDCRIMNTSDVEEAIDMVLWREFDAVRNSINGLAHHHFGSKRLYKVTSGEKLEMLAKAGIDFLSQPGHFRVGTQVRLVPTEVLLTEEELMRIPPNKRPLGPVIRNKMVRTNPTKAQDFFMQKAISNAACQVQRSDSVYHS